MSVVMNAGDRNPFFLEAGAWFTASGACEVLVDRGPTKIRQKIGATEQQVGPFLSDAQILIIATAETTYTVHPAEAWVPASLVPGQIGDLSGITVADYTAFRASTSTAKQIEVVSPTTPGAWVRDTSDTTSSDDPDGGVITRSDSVRYKSAQAFVYGFSRAILKAIEPTAGIAATLFESGRYGVFRWTVGDYSTQVAADTQEGFYIKATSVAATAGAWIRECPDYLNVTHFGTPNDGTAGAATGYQAALDLGDVAGPHPKNVFVPDGAYNFGATGVGFNYPAHIKQSPGAAITYTGTDAAIWAQHATGGTGSEEFIIEGGAIIGGGFAGIKLGRPALSISPGVGCVRDVDISGMDHPLWFVAAQICTVERVKAHDNAKPALFAYTAVSGIVNTAVVLRDCRFNGSDEEGILIEQGWQVILDRTLCEGNALEGLKVLRSTALSGVHQVVVRGGWFEANNLGRAGTGHGQICIENSAGVVPVDFISVRDTNFAINGASNFGIKLDGFVSSLVVDNNRYVDTSGAGEGQITTVNVVAGQAIYAGAGFDITQCTLDALTIPNIGSIQMAKSAVTDVTGAAETLLVGLFHRKAYILSAQLVYTTATGTGLGATTTELGKRTDRDYFATRTLTSSASQWGISNITLTQRVVDADDVVTFYSPNGVGASSGKVCANVEYMLVAG